LEKKKTQVHAGGNGCAAQCATQRLSAGRDPALIQLAVRAKVM
jgi:hypothetical protein